MNAHRLDSETVERLLDGAAAGPRDGPYLLASLLSAIRADPGTDELTGEAAAVRAYRMARHGAPLAVPVARRRGFTLAGLGARAALAGLLVASSGGVALAATGVLPNPLRPQGPPAVPSAPAVPATGPPTGTGPRSAPPAEATDRPAPEASTAKLCRAYRAGVADNPGRALDNPAFAGLVDAAGGRDQVPGYCDRVLATEPGNSHPQQKASDHPGNQPSARPSERATRRNGT